MRLFHRKEFEELAAVQNDYCISIYIPTQRVGENKESRLTLKNTISAVEKKLMDLGLKKTEADVYVDPIKKVVDDSSIWRLLSDTLVIFRSREHFMVKILPIITKECYQVSDRFYMLPVLDLYNQDNTYYIFLLSLNKNKLYEATQHEITEIKADDVLPGNLNETVGYDVVQKSLEFRSRMPGREFAPFHGKGEGKDYKDTEITKYMEEINDGLKDLLDGYGVPIVVAAVESIFSQLKEVSTMKNLYPKCIPGNYDNDNILLIHEKANVLLRSYFDQVKNNKKKKYIEAPDNHIISDTTDVIKAAYMGQVETIFVEKGKFQWGEFDEETGEVTLRNEKKPVDQCLLDYAARTVFLKGGRVFLEDIGDMPESGSPLNAVLRFPL